LVKPVKQSALFDSIVKVFHPEDFAEIENNGQAVMRSVLPRSVIQKNVTLPKKQFLILLVEDNLVNQQVAQHLLGKLGYSIHIANHGKEALEKLDAINYALILMDCQMPVMDGFETTRIIRESESNVNKIRLPIIAMTANAIEGDKKLCLDAGMDDYMTKPISSAVLSKMLDKWLPEEENTEEIELFSISLDDASTNEEVFDESPINRQRLSALFDDDIEIINELLDVFCESLVSLKLKLSSAMDNRSDTIKAIAHEIKGSSYNVGALKLATLAEELEKISLDKNWPEVEKLTAQIHIEMDRAQHFIQNNK
jgi:CheY-like chemotaxis protein/HPt (histidine-containing phosphotransfer) domain-containing protein